MDSLSIIPQRRSLDCGIAALATLFSLRYEDVYVAAWQVDHAATTRGLNLYEMLQVAKRLGTPLTERRRFDLDHDLGILSVRQPKLDHYVVLCRGMVIDPDAGRVFLDADDYFNLHKAKPGVLLALT